MLILQIDSSTTANSASRQLTRKLTDKLSQAFPDAEIAGHDLVTQPLPHHVERAPGVQSNPFVFAAH